MRYYRDHQRQRLPAPVWYNNNATTVNLRTKGATRLQEELSLLRERLEGFAQYNAWEREQMRGCSSMDLAARFTWLDEAYEMARSLDALRPLPTDTPGWLAEVRGIMLMRERLALLGDRHG